MVIYKKVESLSKEAFSRKVDVSRETLGKFTVYIELLTKWQRRINLVGQGTMEDVLAATFFRLCANI